jgi:hypothetical protein
VKKNVIDISHLLLLSLLAILDLDLHKAGNLGAAYRTLVGLHPHDLRALNAQAHVAAREHHGVLSHCEAHHALSLGLICDVRCRVIDPVDVVELEDRVIVLQGD